MGVDSFRFVASTFARAARAERYASHSLRAGLATSVAAGGASERAIHGPNRPPLDRHGQALHSQGEPVRLDNSASLAGL